MPVHHPVNTEIALEAFRTAEAPDEVGFYRQAADISQLIRYEAPWLRQSYYSGAVRRYEMIDDAKKNVDRLAKSDEVRAYVVRSGGIARGLATIIFNQAVIHPGVGEVRGDDLDYWLVPGLNEHLHRATALGLIRQAVAINQSSAPLIATVESESGNPARGFAPYMDRMGDRAELKPVGEDNYDIAKVGRVVQLLELSGDRLRHFARP